MDMKHIAMIRGDIFFFFLSIGSLVQAQPAWQQSVSYEMQVGISPMGDPQKYSGKTKLTYGNHSPDTLYKVYFHLYYHAFKPNSMMDVRSRSISDPDSRVRDRIYQLSEYDQGFLSVSDLKQDGMALSSHREGTVLEVTLAAPLLPRTFSVFTFTFEGRIPIQVRRAGWNNAEGIDYSMSQWYPKMAEYDSRGWHAHSYVAREFHGVWGDYDVKIYLTEGYKVAATGVCMKNPYTDLLEQWGLPRRNEKEGKQKGSKKSLEERVGQGFVSRTHAADVPLEWHYVAKGVHDFVWAADFNYITRTKKVPTGQLLRFFYKKEVDSVWNQMQPYAVRAFSYLHRFFGPYPYSEYSIIQGGDGGMEYPMATLVTGRRSLRSLVGVVVHEMAHSWYQGLLASNESLYAWMDEGLATYAQTRVEQWLWEGEDRFASLYGAYFRMASSGLEERMNGWADHFTSNRAYSIAAYVKGAIFQHQLSYIIGQETLDRSLRRYYATWKFRHPSPNDYIRVVEKESGLHLGWYLEYFANTTHTIDYGVVSATAQGRDSTAIVLERVSGMPMPIELVIRGKEGDGLGLFYIPLAMMRGEKSEIEQNIKHYVLEDWPWTHRYYRLVVPVSLGDIESMEIDPSERMADIDRGNQVLTRADIGAQSWLSRGGEGISGFVREGRILFFRN